MGPCKKVDFFTVTFLLTLINNASRGILTASGETLFHQFSNFFQPMLNLFALSSQLLALTSQLFDLRSELFYSTIGHFYSGSQGVHLKDHPLDPLQNFLFSGSITVKPRLKLDCIKTELTYPAFSDIIVPSPKLVSLRQKPWT